MACRRFNKYKQLVWISHKLSGQHQQRMKSNKNNNKIGKKHKKRTTKKQRIERIKEEEERPPVSVVRLLDRHNSRHAILLFEGGKKSLKRFPSREDVGLLFLVFYSHFIISLVIIQTYDKSSQKIQKGKNRQFGAKESKQVVPARCPSMTNGTPPKK